MFPITGPIGGSGESVVDPETGGWADMWHASPYELVITVYARRNVGCLRHTLSFFLNDNRLQGFQIPFAFPLADMGTELIPFQCLGPHEGFVNMLAKCILQHIVINQGVQ